MMHRLEIVPQRLLREPLRVAAFQSPLRPRIPIRVQRHARNLQPDAALLELRCPVASAHGAKVGKISLTAMETKELNGVGHAVGDDIASGYECGEFRRI